jgi:NADH:ubiquinone oxidoreductase subunit 2 (subunit N)
MASLGSTFLVKNSLFLCYILTYYMLLLGLIVFFFVYNIRYLRYLSELSFYSNYAYPHLYLSFILLAFAGLPPLVFFLPKLAVIAFIILTGPTYLGICVLLLISLG